MRKVAYITKSGKVAIWESGGGASRTGYSHIVCGPNGEKLVPTYIRKGGHLSKGEHALFIANRGHYIIDTYHHCEDFEISVSVIEEVITEEVPTEYGLDKRGHITIKETNHFKDGEWETPLEEKLKKAVQAAIDKATCYHCREPHYADLEGYSRKKLIV